MKQRWLFLITTLIVFIGTVFIAFSRHHATPQTRQAVSKPGSQSSQSVSSSQQPSILSFQGLTDKQSASGIVQIAVNTTGTISLQKVAYYIDGVFAGITYSTPFSFTLDTTKLAKGSHTIEARGYDSQGTEVSTKTITIIIDNAAVTQAPNGSVNTSNKHAAASSVAPTTTNSPPPSPSSSTSPNTQPPSTWPDATNTGYKHAPDYPGSLAAFNGTIRSNTTYNFKDFSGGADVGSTASPVSNVTFHGCRFHGPAVDGQLVGVWGDNITFDYSSFEPDATFVAGTQVAHNLSYQYGIDADGSFGTYVGQMTVSHSDFWGFGNAIDTAGSTQAKPQVFRDNWIHDAADDGNADYHTDGIGTESGAGSGSYVVIDHNTIVSPGNTNGVAFQQGSYSHFTITNNLFGGFGYTVALWAPAPNTTFTGNTFTAALQPVFGPLYPQSFWTSSGSIWHNNKWLVPPGAAYGNAADNGKFWTPDGPSATDYQ